MERKQAETLKVVETEDAEAGSPATEERLVISVEEFQAADGAPDDVVFYRSTTTCTTTC